MPREFSVSEHRFQINLSGLIDLLSNHLYTRPDVFVRELLQNATDAIQARLHQEPAHVGCIELHVDDQEQVVTFTDNGIGLTEAEMHRFLAVIGESSKRGDLLGQPRDFIGQFGIGMLACFMVADEIEVISRSVREPEASAMCWRGRPDGTYDISAIEGEQEIGTRVRLQVKPEAAGLFRVERLIAAAKYYGGILPWPLQIFHAGQAQLINDGNRVGQFPWDASHLPEAQRREFWLEYGRKMLDVPVFDAIPLKSKSGGVDGVAFVLERSPAQAARRSHRVYLKRMLLSETVDNLLPSWAFFVQGIVNCTELHPTAARNAFYQDATLERTQEELGACLRAYIVDLAEHHPKRLEELISCHYLALKALALEDEAFFRLFAHWLPIETSYGRSTLQEYLQRNQRLLCTRRLDEFRQIAQIAAAQGIDIINGGYTYDTEIVERYGELFPDTSVRFVEPSDIGHQLQGLSPAQEASHAGFLSLAGGVLEPFECVARLKIFEPNELPTLFIVNQNALLSRQISASAEMADDLWSEMLGEIKPEAISELCFNFSHPLVRRLIAHPDASLVQRVVQILYVQALLMGHYPLGRRELGLMSDGLAGLLEWSLMGTGGVVTWH